MASEAILRGLEIAQNEMMMSSGQFQSQMGENENAKSGKAIAERQRQGDNATYHYVDHLAIALRHTGRILVDLIPKIYDTKRVLLVRGQDASEKTITIDPEQQQAVQGQISKQEAAAQLIFNPNVGKYSVEIDPGPSYSTKRQEAWNAISQILTMNQGLTSVIGDILFRNADFPGADEIAERLRRTINPSFLGEAPPPQVQAMLQQAQQELQRSQSLVGELVSKLAEEKLKTAARDAQKSVDVYDAETRRITAISNAQPELGLGAIKPVVQQTLAEMLGFNLEAVQGAMTNGMQTAAGSGQLGAQVG